MKKQAKKLKLAKETVAALLPQAAGGVLTALCNTVRNCPTGPEACPQSGKYPC